MSANIDAALPTSSTLCAVLIIANQRRRRTEARIEYVAGQSRHAKGDDPGWRG